MLKLRCVPKKLAVGLSFICLQTAGSGTWGQSLAVPLPGQTRSWIELKVIQRDTLIGLSKQILVSPQAWREVARLNQLINPNFIQPGQILRIPLNLVKTQMAEAQVLNLEGPVHVRRSHEAAPQLLQVGDKLAEGALVQTTARSSAVLSLADGSQVRILPNSLAALGLSRMMTGRAVNGLPVPASVAANAPSSAPLADATRPDISTAANEGWFVGTMRLVRGSLEILASKVLRAKPLEVETPTTVVGVRGTDYRVGVNSIDVQEGVAAKEAAPGQNNLNQSAAEDNSHIEVLEGKVNVAAQPAPMVKTLPPEADLKAGMGASVSGAGEMHIEPLLPAPDLSHLPARIETSNVLIEWPHLDPLRIQLSNQANFENILFDVRLPPHAPLRIEGLAAGRFFLRARRISAADIEGYDGVHEFLLKARPIAPNLQEPLSGSLLPIGPVKFSWQASMPGLRWHFQVAQDPDFKYLLADQAGLTEPAMLLSLPQAGLYYWRVSSQATDGEHGAWGQAWSLMIDPPPPIAAVVPVDQLDRLVLLWQDQRTEPQHDLAYLIELARDPAFRDLIVRKSIGTSQWQINAVPHYAQGATPAEGRAYFRYRIQKGPASLGSYSPVLEIELPKLKDRTGIVSLPNMLTWSP